MRVYEFTLLIEPLVTMDDAFVDAFYPTCDDSLVVLDERSPSMDFAREAGSYLEAVISAIADVEDTDVATVVRVEPEDLVSASQIAKRTGRSRESIRLLYEGERGPGDFPEPLNPELKSRLWRWPEVQAWMAAHDEEFAATLDESKEELVEQERIRAGINAVLDARCNLHPEELEFVYSEIAVQLNEMEPGFDEFLEDIAGFASVMADALAFANAFAQGAESTDVTGLKDETSTATFRRVEPLESSQQNLIRPSLESWRRVA